MLPSRVRQRGWASMERATGATVEKKKKVDISQLRSATPFCFEYEIMHNHAMMKCADGVVVTNLGDIDVI